MNPRSPIFIEIVGTPAAGKTTLAGRIGHYLNRSGVSCFVAEEAALSYPGPSDDKLAPAFNEWTLAESMEAIDRHRSNRQFEVIILDRGVVDSLYWLSWFRSSRGYNEERYLKSVQLARPGVKLIGFVIFLTCTLDVAQSRRPGAGRIMNQGIYPQLLANYNKQSVALEIGVQGLAHFRLDTGELQIGTVESRVRSFLAMPQDGSREDLLAALIRGQSTPR